MKSTTFAAAASVLALASSATAQQAYNQSQPFVLLIDSDEARYADLALEACHTGAAEESLCVQSYDGPAYYNTFVLNRTLEEYTGAPATTDTTPGLLTFTLEASSINVSEPLSLYYDPFNNVAEALFLPGPDTNIQIGFNDQNLMNIDGVEDAYYWQICDKNILGYEYTNLAWVVGGGIPQGYNCTAVNVTRSFV